MCNALVAELTATENFEPTKLDIFFSNAGTLFPVVINLSFKAFLTFNISALSIDCFE